MEVSNYDFGAHIDTENEALKGMDWRFEILARRLGEGSQYLLG